MLSIIIPTYNEEEKIGALVGYLQTTADIDEAEIVVIDGGSTDRTKKRAEDVGAKVWESPKKGRAAQMNYGAHKSKGKYLYFLHADTQPPKSFKKDIQRAIDQDAKSGCFRLQFDRDHIILKFYAWFTRFDVDVFRFGDQSLFVERGLFEQVGEFDESLVVMEDQEIVKRIKKHAQFRIIPKAVTTSGRRYEQVGVFKLQLIFSIIVLLFYVGVDQSTIVNFYRKHAIKKNG